MRVHPKRVLITGASGGIGQAFAQALPTSCDLVLTGRDRARLGACVGMLEHPGRNVEVVAADLSTPEGIAAVVEVAAAAPLDGLINNAGTAPSGAFVATDADALARAVDLNCGATVALCRALLPTLLAGVVASRRRAMLINVASTTAYAPVPRLAVYAASKAFVLSFTEALAEELRREPIEVLALCPGPTRTAGLPLRLPIGVRSPQAVAAVGLAALGRTTVAYTDAPTRLALVPLTRARAAVGRALDAGLAWTLRA